MSSDEANTGGKQTKRARRLVDEEASASGSLRPQSQTQMRPPEESRAKLPCRGPIGERCDASSFGMMQTDDVDVDGSMLEAGGQVLRVTSALGLLRRRVAVSKIRSGRPTPGLRPQHVASMQLVAAIGGSRLEGCHVGSCEVAMVAMERDRAARRDRYEANATTAGAMSLMVQAAVPALVVVGAVEACTRLALRGGSNVAHAPSLDHVALVLAPNLDRLGVTATVGCERRGFYPEGGGRATVDVRVRRRPLQAVDMSSESAEPVAIRAVVCGRGPPRSSGDRAASALVASLREAFPGTPAEVRVEESPWDRGSKQRKRKHHAIAVQLALSTSSGSTIGADGLFAGGNEGDVRGVVDTLRARFETAGGGVDEQTADQLVPYMALADGASRLRCPKPTCLHLATATTLAAQLTGATFRTIEEGESIIVECAPSTTHNRLL